MSARLSSSSGLPVRTGSGGVRLLPQQRYSQGDRPATSHTVLVQSPHVYPNLNTLAVLVQLYDDYGNSAVSTAPLTVRASFAAGGADVVLTGFARRGPAGARFTRRYVATVPSSWFQAADPAGSTAQIVTSLSGYDAYSSNLTVYGTPSWFSSRLSAAGISSLFTSDQAGRTPAETMRAGQTFYLQLFATTASNALPYCMELAHTPPQRADLE